MPSPTLAIFGLVYLGMILGRVPWLKLDRTGIAVLGGIALVATGQLDTHQAWNAVDVPTLALLLGTMVISAQFRLGGFYTAVTRRLAAGAAHPAVMLAAVVVVAGVLSALLTNDIVCLAMAPILVESCLRRRLDPVPMLLGLACASNVGSAATVIGNPQNMLIGQSLGLPFAPFLRDCGVPAAAGLVAVWAVIARRYRGRWSRALPMTEVPAPAFNAWQTAKGLAVLTAVIAAFVLAPWPREVVVLAGAGVLLASRRLHSREVLGLVDWQLLLLFMGLFTVNYALGQTGAAPAALTGLRSHGIDVGAAPWLFALTVVLSNLVSNVPAVMLLLDATHRPSQPALLGPMLALASTFAGNLFVVGSIANIIVIDQSARCGVAISWREHARVGVPVTVVTLALAALWLWLLGR